MKSGYKILWTDNALSELIGVIVPWLINVFPKLRKAPLLLFGVTTDSMVYHETTSLNC